MRKFLSFALTIIVFSSIQTNANAAIKTGDSCGKAGLTTVVKGFKYTCITQGKKKVWGKGVKVVANNATKPTPAPSPTPTPEVPKLSITEILWSEAINGKFPIESEKFAVPAKLPTSWDDIYENREGIAYKAWQSVSQTIQKSTSKAAKFSLLQGPNTISPITDWEGRISVTSKAFPTAPEPSKLTVIVFNYKDSGWADKTFRELISTEPESFKQNYNNIVLDMCQSQRQMCWSAMGFTDTKGNGWALIGVVDGEAKKNTDLSYSGFLRSDKGFTMSHEYFHTIQRKILGDRWYQMNFVPPTWFNEGTAVFVEGAAPNYDSFDGFMRFRAVDSKLASPACKGGAAQGCLRITETLMLDFLELKHYSNNWSNFPYATKSEVSARIAEILAAVKGHESITDLYTYMATGHSFEEAFLHIYGITYKSAIPLISKILADQF